MNDSPHRLHVSEINLKAYFFLMVLLLYLILHTRIPSGFFFQTKMSGDVESALSEQKAINQVIN